LDAGPAQQLYVVSASSDELADSMLLQRILCTIKLAKEIEPGGA
jgi:hypothetical protein